MVTDDEVEAAVESMMGAKFGSSWLEVVRAALEAAARVREARGEAQRRQAMERRRGQG